MLLIAVMLAYYIVTAFQVYKWSDRKPGVNAARVPWPDWAWAMGAGAAVCWFLAAGIASGKASTLKRAICMTGHGPSKLCFESGMGMEFRGAQLTTHYIF